jgi:hypothetical protein
MTLTKFKNPMASNAQIPCTKPDREKFKEFAARERKTMTTLFHEWVEKYEKSVIK